MAKHIETQWAVFSANFLKFHRIPFGSELRIIDINGRKKRADFVVNRERINHETMTRIDDAAKVSDLLHTVLTITVTDLSARKLRVTLVGPDGRVLNGNTLIRNVKLLPRKLTESDKEREAEEAHHALEAQASADASLIEAEYQCEDPAAIVCLGFVRALVARYGRKAVLEAVEH